jgi:protein involved in polysaccharide export with SLBB domain
MRRVLFRPILVAAALLLCAGRGEAQHTARDNDFARLQMSRDELKELLARFESTARASSADKELHERARYEAALIRARLEEGDFQVGDRIDLSVQGEPTLSTPFTVAAGTVLRLPTIGDVPLRGVLRSELEPYLATEIGRYLKEPVVRAQALIRVSVLGAVATPGYYVVPADALLTDALMSAGGPVSTAKFSGIRVERGKERIWQGNPLQRAITEGRTLDQLSLRAGDRIFVPAERRVDWIYILGTAAIVIPATVALRNTF